MKTLAERLKFARASAGLSQADVANGVQNLRRGRSTFSQQAYSFLESGKALNSVELPSIAKVLGVEFEWLIGNKMEMHGDGLRDVAPAKSAASEPKMAAIIEADVRSSRGFSADKSVGEWVLPRQLLSAMNASPDNIVAFEVLGDSMEPKLRHGDRVFVDKRLVFPNPEGVFVLWDGHSIVVKQVQIIRGQSPMRLRIISINNQYPQYEAQAKDVIIIGRLIGVFSRE